MSDNDVLGLDIVLPTNLDMRQHHRHHRAMSHGSQRSWEEPPTDKQDKGHIESRRSSGGSRRGHRRTRAVDFVDLSMLRLSIVPDGPESDARDDAEVEGEESANPLFYESTSRDAHIATPVELGDFVSRNPFSLMVIDVRHPNEPSDAMSLAVAGFPDKKRGYRPRAINLPWRRESDSMELPSGVEKDTPIIVHCSGGLRGRRAKDYLENNGFTNVLNGGGPREADCWAVFGAR